MGLTRSPMKPGTTEMKRTGPLTATKPMARGTSQLARPTKPMAAIGARGKRMRQGKVAANAEEQAWMDKARAFGCIACYLQLGVRTPAVIHHILSGGRRMGHLFTIPLCEPGHHQHSPTPAKISRHPNKARFEAAYGTELEMLEMLRVEVNITNLSK